MRRIATKWFVVAGLGLMLIALAGSRAAHVWGSGGPQRADTSFCPNNQCVSITAPSTTPTLYPGGPPADLLVTFNNLTSGPIHVHQVTVHFSNSWQSNGPSSCSQSDFAITDKDLPTAAVGPSTDGSGDITVTFPSVQTINANSSWGNTLDLAFRDTQTNQDVCQGQPLTLTYSTAAEYTVPTSTLLTQSTNSSADTATLTATVTSELPAPAGRPPASGDGTVQFFMCTTSSASSCSSTPFATASNWTPSGTASNASTATTTMPASSVGSYNIEAQFVPTDTTSFTGSPSSITPTTLTGCVTAQTGSATNIINKGTTYSGNLTVGNGTSVWLNGGIINGNVTVAGTGEFAATGGTINGNVQSSGGPIAMSGTTVTGNVQSTNGGLALGPATVIKGNAQIQGGGPFCSQGTSASQGQVQAAVQVRGNLLVQSLTSTTTASVCSTTVGNNLQWQSNASPGLIGSCGSDTILGNLQVQSNSGPVTIGATGSGNATYGNTIVQSNTGGGTLTGNSSGGNCLLSGDKPGIVGTSNSAKGANNQCNTGSAGA